LTSLTRQITKRGHPPLGGGEVVFRCPAVKKLKANFDFTSVGRAIKIRGIACVDAAVDLR